MTEKQAYEYIESISGRGIVPGLESMERLCGILGNPQKNLKFIHVAGTNGKGSVSSYIANALKQAGVRVGRYISPVIFEYRERIQVNDRMITKTALGRLMEQVKDACDRIVADGFPHPTAFEVETALGFLYFLEKKCDVVVLEVGMGGTLDATNIIDSPLLCVIASISMDHMKFLGKTITEIAANKAGIIKEGTRVVSADQEPEAACVLKETAQDKQVPIRFVDENEIKNVKYGLKKQSFDYRNMKKAVVSLSGTYQIQNAALALEALWALQELGYKLTEEQIRKGLAETVWPGRFTVVETKPLFVVDGAHNRDAAQKLAQSIEFYFTNKRIIYIMGILKDKEYTEIINLTHKYADQIITVATPGNARAMSSVELANEVAKVHENVTSADSVEEAVEMAKLLAGKDDVILAFGSLSFLGRIMEILHYEKRF